MSALFQPRAQVSRKASAEASAVTSHQSITRTVTTTATTGHATHPRQPQRKKLVFGWIQDVSGSMSGNRIEASLRGFDHMFENVCQPSDYLGVVTYNGDLNTLHLPMAVQHIDPSRDKANIRKGLQGKYQYDRMYDAVGASILGLQAMAKDKKYAAVTQDAVYQLLLLTDGGDNYSSDFTLSALTKLVAHPGLPNFHLVVVAVSMSDHDKQKLRGLCAPDHATFLDVENFGDLQHTLHAVGEEVQQRLVVTTTTVTKTVVQSHGQRGGGGRGVQTITEGIAATRLSLPAPPGPQKAQAVARKARNIVVDERAVCHHFLAGRCVFGKKCRNLHPVSLVC